MRDERWIIVVEEDRKIGAGWAKIFGTVFLVVMTFALVDRGLTVAWVTATAWLNRHLF
ncbi:hypothetical protein C8J36_11463 [Rhizobium sp. PP-F2F-G48]|uniref:hypothetical protein n=1 Tax=Rhizobium sp. PP-F2F-G48 TaxID=2135651 RepID=UPI0010E307E0|nr:hypothetical protein [Rhizobium sp. PP-F2F-G48]TCM48363.1 hypothetical protein C8J36_11463 [Rhizobium sp. PP-F2F-G48]